MDRSHDSEVAQLLEGFEEGNLEAQEKLLGLIYEQLHTCAAGLMRRQSPQHTLQATALVNEACIRLLSGELAKFRNRDHLLRVAARAMRQILTDHARGKKREKREPEGNATVVPLDSVVTAYDSGDLDLVALDDALRRLEQFDPLMARAVELRYFGGLTLDQIAGQLGMPDTSFRRQWKSAQAWLYKEILGGQD